MSRERSARALASRRSSLSTCRDRPRYMISVAAELVGNAPADARLYEAKGLVRPGRTPGGTRLYSEVDLERLRLIQRLTTELGLNLAGVEQVSRLQDELNRMRARMERLERELRAEIAEVHRSYKREVVLYEPAQAPGPEEGVTMDFNKLTLKIAGGRRRRAGARAPHGQSGAHARPSDDRAPRPGAPADARRPRRATAPPSCAPRRRRGCAACRPSRAERRSRRRRPRSAACSTRAFDEMRALGDEFVSVEHLLLALDVVPRDALLEALAGRARRPEGDVAGSRGHLPGAREVRARPDRARRGREARPGHRPRRGDPPRDPGALAADEEQPRADRRARCRQDRDRRGARAADRRRRRPRGLEGQARLGARRRRAARGREVPRRVRGAAEGRARGDPERSGRDRPLHRRAAHDRRRGRRPRAPSTRPTC